MRRVRLMCSAHPTYQAIRAPKADCQPCWDIWFLAEKRRPDPSGHERGCDGTRQREGGPDGPCLCLRSGR
jgi:hypothetical protein